MFNRPPYGREFASIVDAPDFAPILPVPGYIEKTRQAESLVDHDVTLRAAGIDRADYQVPTADGAEITVSALRAQADPVADLRPCVIYFHGGGMIIGNRFSDMQHMLGFIRSHDVVVVTVEYRLAPEHPAPTQVLDAVDAIRWVAANTDLLGVNPDQMLIAGQSAGGGITASAALYIRDHGGPKLIGQLLTTPMLDDRNDTVSAKQFDGVGQFDRQANIGCWHEILGARRGGPDVTPYEAAARATDFSNLPPSYLDGAGPEVFRDEICQYAAKLWAAGNDAELHIWAGGFHSSLLYWSDTVMSEANRNARNSWLTRRLKPGS